MRKVVDWANLEELPLSLVLDKLEEHIDHIRFGVVCKSWISVAKLNHQNHQFRISIPPMLMILTDELSRRHTKTNEKRSLYSILGHKEYPIAFLSHMKIKWCMGYSFGWLSLMDYNDAITLVNPFKCSTIPPISLPPLKFVYKVTLSADPITSPNNYAVAAIYGFSHLAFKRASQPFWIHIENECAIIDVVFYKGLLFADGSGKTIVSFKMNNPPCDDPNFTYYEKIATTTYSVPMTRRVHFVKSLNGDIWMVRSYVIDLNKLPYSLDVYKLELDVQSGKLDSLEDNILFVGIGDSISVPASCFSKLEKDSIYFIDDLDMDDLELKVYIMKDGSCQRQSLPISFKWMQPFWVLPEFQWD